MTILLTGGAGFIGSSMVRFLLEHESSARVVVLDKLTYAGNPENLRDVEQHSGYAFVKGDIADVKLVDELFAKEQFDVVINYAAETHVDRSIHEPRAFLMTDVLGTHTLLEAVKKHEVKRMIQISTDEVFGSIAKGAFTEESPFKPNSPYSASKAGGDHLCRAYAQTYDTPVIVTHACNVYGPWQYPEKIIPLFVTNLLEGKSVPVYGTGEQVREWIHAKDHCRAIHAIMQNGVNREVYNIGTGDERTNIELTKMLLALLKKDESSIEHVEDRLGHDVRYAIDSTKLRETLDWKPTVSFEDGLRETVEWYKTHNDWWKNIKSGEYLEYIQKQYKNRV